MLFRSIDAVDVFVTPGKYIYSVDDEYNGVVIRGEC